MIYLKRAYDAPAKRDGLRILVERLWPRGVSKEKAAIDLWLKTLAPSAELRKYYNHVPEKWPEFRKRYWRELVGQTDLLSLLNLRAQEGPVTFIYSAHDEERNSAVALKEYLEEKL